MFNLFKERSLSEQELSERAESLLGVLLKENGPNDFKAMVEVGYLRFTANSVGYFRLDLGLPRSFHNDTICYVKLSDVSMLKTVRPAVLSESGWMIPQEIRLASVQIAKLVKPWKG